MSWDEVPLRRVFRIVNGGTPTSDEQYWDGDVQWVTPVDIGSVDGKYLNSTQRSLTKAGVLTGSRTVPGGSLVLSTRAPIGYVAQISRIMAFNQGCRGLVPTVPVDTRYFRYQLLSLREELVSRGAGSTFMELSTDSLATVPMILPPLDEQRRIADFLDGETAQIDALRASRRSQISVLDELELARIGKQLSEVEKTGPVYAYFDVQLGKMLNAERASGDSQQPYLRNANVHWYEIDTEDMATMTFESDEHRRYGVQAGDLLVCEGGAGVAEAAVWDGRISTCFYQKSLHRVRARSHVPVEWMMYWLRYAKAIGTFNADGNLATIPHLTGEQLAEYRIQIPEDGHRRVAELSSEITAIRMTQHEMAAADALLAERRQALITAAVTGQIDVTTAEGVAV
jgi:type I restriction enzyme S subunit